MDIHDKPDKKVPSLRQQDPTLSQDKAPFTPLVRQDRASAL